MVKQGDGHRPYESDWRIPLQGKWDSSLVRTVLRRLGLRAAGGSN